MAPKLSVQTIDPSKELVDLFQVYNNILMIHPVEGSRKSPFPVQKTLLASVSTKLANHCMSRTLNGECFLQTTFDVLRAFFNWILRCPLRMNEQTTMVEAWRFGHEWEIPVFQNEVMRCLVADFRNNSVDLWAMSEAYEASSSEDVARDRLLRGPFIMEFAHESRDQIWSEDAFFSSGLDGCTDFHRDYVYTMCVDCDSGYGPRTDGAKIEELLVSESLT